MIALAGDHSEAPRPFGLRCEKTRQQGNSADSTPVKIWHLCMYASLPQGLEEDTKLQPACSAWAQVRMHRPRQKGRHAHMRIDQQQVTGVYLLSTASSASVP